MRNLRNRVKRLSYKLMSFPTVHRIGGTWFVGVSEAYGRSRVLARGLVLNKGVSRVFLVLSWHSSPSSLLFFIVVFVLFLVLIFSIGCWQCSLCLFPCHAVLDPELLCPDPWPGAVSWFFAPDSAPEVLFQLRGFSHRLPSFWPYSPGPVRLHSIGEYVYQPSFNWLLSWWVFRTGQRTSLLFVGLVFGRLVTSRHKHRKDILIKPADKDGVVVAFCFTPRTSY